MNYIYNKLSALTNDGATLLECTLIIDTFKEIKKICIDYIKNNIALKEEWNIDYALHNQDIVDHLIEISRKITFTINIKHILQPEEILTIVNGFCASRGLIK